MSWFSFQTWQKCTCLIIFRDSLYSFKKKIISRMTPWENHTLTKAFLSMVVYRKQTECVKMSSVLFTIRSQYPARKTDKYGTHTTDRLTILCVVRISYNTPNPSAIKLTGNKCLFGFRFPLLPASPRHAPSVFPLTGSQGPAWSLAASFVRCLLKHWYMISKESEIFPCQFGGTVLHCICLNQTCNCLPCLFCLAGMTMANLFVPDS